MYPHERSLVKRLEGRPFALIGINSDNSLDSLRPILRAEKITWRSFWNGPEGPRGPLSEAWGVVAWPTTYVLDAQGRIRYRNVHGEKMDGAVDTLLEELEGERR